MQAVIMAGGKGTRLASLTHNIPKPMVPINGKPLLEYQIENLKQNGVDNVIFITGYLGEVIQNHFGDGHRFGIDISYYNETTPLGTAGALSKIADRLDQTFYLVFGDLFFNVNFKRFLAFHQDHNSAITLYAHPNSHPYDSDIVIVDQDNRVINWSYKKDIRTSDYRNLVNAGLYVVQRDIVKEIESIQQEKNNDFVDLEKELIIPRLHDLNVCAYSSTEYVKDIGTPDRLLKVTKDFLNGICENRNLSHKQKCIFLDRDGTINKFVGFLRSKEQLALEPNAATAIRMINESEYLAIVISNQPVIARGETTFSELEQIHNRLHTLLGKEGAYLDGLFFCPHHPDKGFEGEVKELKIQCNCRKPKIGMIEEAMKEYNIDLKNSWFIGDTPMDVQTGINAGMKTIMLKSGDPQKSKYDVVPDYLADDLLDGVIFVLQNHFATDNNTQNN